jgi:hypothetical protein
MTTIPPSAQRSATSQDVPAFPEQFEVVGWVDTVVDAVGFPPHHAYGELLWLPIVGPSTTWLYRRLTTIALHKPAGAVVRLDELALVVGLGDKTGPNSPVQHSLQRLVRFGLGRWRHGRLAVRTSLPPQRHLHRLTPELRAAHRALIGGRTTPDHGPHTRLAHRSD